MKFSFSRFNIYLLAVAIGVTAGCSTSGENTGAGEKKKKKDKEATTLRLHLEVNPDGSGRNSPVKILRTDPVVINVDLKPFLTEGDIEQAWVIDELGGFALKLQYRAPDGVRLLEMYTGSYKGKRIAVFSQFGDARWLGAPLITQRITNGGFVFTPDTTREEADRIVRGLNNVAKEIKKKYGL